MSSAIVVQCFVKTDTLEGLCASLLRCENREAFHLIFWHDVPPSGPKGEKYLAQNEAVRAFLADFAAREAGSFASVSVHGNAVNKGTAATCQASLDHAFAAHDFVIFTEDDTIFARDALTWFAGLRDLDLLAAPDVLALAGESIYFDARRNQLPLWYAAQARRVAHRRGLASDYVKLKFLPSTCFATTRAKWATFGAVRGQPRGPEAVCKLCIDQTLFAVFPVVARVKDIGMLHESGYSVGIHGAEGVKEIKNTYLMADDLPPLTGKPKPYTGNMDQLFQESAKLTGFAVPAARPAARPWKLLCAAPGHFGDTLTALLLNHYGVPFEMAGALEEATLLGIGSTLDLVAPGTGPLVVWSAGFRAAPARPVEFGPAVRFLAVRGYHSDALIQPARRGDFVIADGGLLAARLVDAAAVAKTCDLGIVPHATDRDAVAALGLAGWPGAKIIDVTAPAEQTLRDIAGCRRIAASSLHGVVVADAFGIPNVRVTFAGGRTLAGGDFRFGDHASSLGYEAGTVAVGEETTREGLMAAIDQAPPHPAVPAATLNDLETTLQVLRGAARGWCDV
jgi:hypothetical protein